MKYYSEGETNEIRLALESEILTWYKVNFKKMFGCPCYTANGKLFVFLVKKGIVITRLGEADIAKLSMSYNTISFRGGNKEMKNWRQISVRVRLNNHKESRQEMLSRLLHPRILRRAETTNHRRREPHHHLSNLRHVIKF